MMEGQVEMPTCPTEIDWNYEFSAPQYFDFSYEETQDDVEEAERWFASAIPYEASPHVSKTKSMAELFTAANKSGHKSDKAAQQILAHVSPSPKQANKLALTAMDYPHEYGDAAPGFTVPKSVLDEANGQVDPCTPEGQRVGGQGLGVIVSPIQALVNSPLPAKRLYSEAWSESGPRHAQASKTGPKNSRLSMMRRSNTNHKNEASIARTAHGKVSAQELQAIKKQKLEGGKLKQIQVVKDSKQKNPKPKLSTALTVPQEFNFCTNTRVRVHAGDSITPQATSKTMQRCQSVQASRLASPFISMAERVRMFQDKTPERFHRLPSGVGNSHHVEAEKPKLRLTKPKTPELETMQRSRPPRVKSSAELEDEMLAKLPKFKARPLPKKILESPAIPMITKSTPQLPEFQEFHLHTMERAQHHPKKAESDLVDELKERRNSAPIGARCLTEPRPPRLQTAQRARPTTIKSTADMEAEELAKIPKFKALPLNKRIFKSKGDLGLFRNHKRQITLPNEFHLKTDERAQVRGPSSTVEQFGKLTLKQETKTEVTQQPRQPKPFHLATDDRGLAKQMKKIQEQIEREQKEAEARIPKAQLLPYTTDYPIVPSKPEPKECTKPVPFQLVSLMRHDEEQQRLAAGRAQAEQLEALLKEFRAQPNFSNAPVFVPVRSRKPLTEVQEFKLNVDTRAIERAEFDKKVTEKQNMYNHYREEYEAARKAEEEKFIRAMRREMVVVARPVPSFAKPFVPQRSSKEPTKPTSPQFSQRTPREEHRLARMLAQESPSLQRRIHMR